MRGDTFGSEYKKIDYDLIKRLLVYIKPYQKYVVIASVLTILVALLGPVRPYLTKIAIDDHISTHDYKGLLNIVIYISILLFVNSLTRFLLTYLMQWVGQSILNDIRLKLYSHIQHLSMKFHDKNPVGRMVTRVTNDVETLNQLFSSGLVMMIADVMLIFCILGFMFYTDTRLTLLTIIVLPLLLLVTSIFRRKVRDLFAKLRAEVSKLNTFLNEFISGISTVKLFGQESKLNYEFDQINLKIQDYNIKTIFYYALFYPAVEMISAIAIGIVLWYSAENILSNMMTVGILIAFLQYAQMFFRPIRDISEKYTTLQNAMASSERIFATLDNDDLIDNNGNLAEFKGIHKDIEFKNLWFSYGDNKWVLQDINFTIKKGETIAIVGATGSGKSTIINLLSRFYDYEKGEILIDGININEYSQDSIRKRIAIVQQDVFLFSRSIKDNITMGNNSIGQLELEHSTKSLGAYDFIMQLNNGFDTLVSERGQTLSAGQRQLISFCRAYISNPELLILDEATSNIDTETEQVIENSLETLLKDRTSIVIAHRLSTIKKANKIVVLHKGQIKEIGSHKELLAQHGFYSKLYQLQYENLETR
ncbi:MAG TPA: ABC transporter ATP-binding protein [Candidatus Kapabacteria bacterium]|nr:ABC transporter ATP-binding protein [Candidatus Kapabacteria bacterium]